MESGDLEDVVLIEQKSFSTSWPLKTFHKLLMDPNVELWVALQDEHLMGYAVLWRMMEEAELTNIAVREGGRNRGVGSALLSKALDMATSLDVKSVFLEVRSSNQDAISLYERFNFHLLGIRKNYYREPPEDALIMRKVLE
jgi:ribosomal-protein-alanine N-acetyltransferase